MFEYKHLENTFGPVFDKDSEILILGSFPSVKSREISFYYGHPQNRFWAVLNAVYGSEIGQTIEEKRAFLLNNHIALWDVIESCDIVGSSDSSIKNVYVNELNVILKECTIKQIYVNGKTAARLYIQYIKPVIGIEATVLPSTSPANASMNLQKLVDSWKVINK